MATSTTTAKHGRIMRMSTLGGVTVNSIGGAMTWGPGRPDIHNRCEQMLHVAMWDGCANDPPSLVETTSAAASASGPLVTAHGYSGTYGWQLWVNQTHPTDLSSNPISGAGGTPTYTVTPTGGTANDYGITGHFSTYGLRSTAEESTVTTASRWTGASAFQEGNSLRALRFPSVEVGEDEYVVYFMAYRDNVQYVSDPNTSTWDQTDSQSQYVVDCRGSSSSLGRDGAVSVIVCEGMEPGTFTGPLTADLTSLGLGGYGIFGYAVKKTPVLEPCVVTYGWDYSDNVSTTGQIVPIPTSGSSSAIQQNCPWPYNGTDPGSGAYASGDTDHDFRSGDLFVFGNAARGTAYTTITAPAGETYDGIVNEANTTYRHSFAWKHLMADGAVPEPWEYDYNTTSDAGWWWVLIRGVSSSTASDPATASNGSIYANSSATRAFTVKTDWTKPYGICIMGGGNESGMRMEDSAGGFTDWYGPLISLDSQFMIGWANPNMVQSSGDPGTWGAQSSAGNLTNSVLSFDAAEITSFLETITVADSELSTVLELMEGPNFIIGDIQAGVEVGTSVVSFRTRRDKPRRQFLYVSGLDGDTKGVLS